MTSRRSRGSAALELALLTPVALLMIELVVAGGRISQTQSIVDEAAHAGARAASEATTVSSAEQTAVRVVRASLADDGNACVNPTVVVDLADFHAGGSASVDVTCDASLRDLTLLPLPGSHPVHARVKSTIDIYGGA